ncbi:MAG TPA: hypothetical protein VJN92_04940 [Candidatus Acidoferrum sp.]|nr:hypothetical protein [Candidatus Acidoferrum sp.]
MNEPDFSSATATVGDPVICHLRSQQEFGRILFPRGSMLGGHLEAEKEPGHFWGKGYLKITFDRVILPYGDLPVPAKVIQAKGFKVDKKGDIDGKGHAKRDVAEWMIPLLWPWKVVSLPMRGPRPALKGEESLELRLMDDISIPATMAYGPMKPDRPPYASSAQPSTFRGSGNIAEPAIDTKIAAGESVAVPSTWKPPVRSTILVLKSNDTFTLSKYERVGGVLVFEELDGTKGAVEMNLVDWRRTTERNQLPQTNEPLEGTREQACIAQWPR